VARSHLNDAGKGLHFRPPNYVFSILPKTTCKQHFGLTACQAQMMPQVILHVRMVFLAYTLTQLLMADDSISVGDMQKHLRSLHCLYQPNEDPKLVAMKGDGTLLPISLAEAINPVRTYIPRMMDTYIPTITESMKVA
jgi:hypothetical protein